MSYSELQQDFAESTYTPEFARTFVRISAHVKTAVYQDIIILTLAVCKEVVISILNFVFR